MDFQQNKERYLHDANFHKLVNFMCDVLAREELGIGVMDLVAATNLAIDKFTMENARPICKYDWRSEGVKGIGRSDY